VIFKIPSPIFFANVDFFREKLNDAVSGQLTINPQFHETHNSLSLLYFVTTGNLICITGWVQSIEGSAKTEQG
jgi:hypothetical protein